VFHFELDPADKTLLVMKHLILIATFLLSLSVAAQPAGNSGQPVKSTLEGPIGPVKDQVAPPQLNLPPLPPQHPALNKPFGTGVPGMEPKAPGTEPMKILNPPVMTPPGAATDENPSERMAGSEGDYGSHGSSGGGSYSSGNPTASASQLQGHSSRGFAPIVDPFKIAFPQCTEQVGLGQCTYVPLGIWGDQAHRARQSCHNAGEAIDVGLPFQCTNGGRIEAKDPRAMAVARCFANNQGGKFGVIFQDVRDGPNMFPGGTRGAHNGHMHIQLRFCRMITGG
jgi:hypothetical protein